MSLGGAGLGDVVDIVSSIKPRLGQCARGIRLALTSATLSLMPLLARSGEPPPLAPPNYYHVFKLDRNTYAISEPKYWQQNVSYLVLGSQRALLFDTGPGIYSIKAVVRSITQLPIVVIPSHLHFDHVGDLQEFDEVKLLDTPALRSQVHDGFFEEPPDQSLLRTRIRYRVSGWIIDGQEIELGGRAIRLLSTPGHTPDSVSLIDASHHRMFTGDLVNRIVSLCDVPGSDVAAMASSLRRLRAAAPAGSLAYEAHSEAPIRPAELKRLSVGVDAIAAGRATPKPMCLAHIPMLRYDVGPFAIVLPTADGTTLPPFGSVIEEIAWLAGPCPDQSH